MSGALRHAIMNSAIIFAGLVVYVLLLELIIANADLAWLQNAEAYFVYSLQNLSGVGVSFNASASSLDYSGPAFSVYVIALCTGIAELLFFSFLVLLFRGPSWRTKARGLAICLPLIFAINLARLLAVYPLALWLGVQAMWELHWLVWKYGMFIVLMALFAAWYLLMARKEMLRVVQK